MAVWKDKIISLLKRNNTPREIALGVAIGVFIGISPLYGLHTALVIICALIIPRVNKLAILIGTNISIPPTLPFITWLAYNLGRMILDKEYPPLSWSMFSQVSRQGIGGLWKSIVDIYYPLFVGSMVLGTLCAATAYLLTLMIVRRIKREHVPK
jgi:uncharacterized protein (TIGR03546 family)